MAARGARRDLQLRHVRVFCATRNSPNHTSTPGRMKPQGMANHDSGNRHSLTVAGISKWPSSCSMSASGTVTGIISMPVRYLQQMESIQLDKGSHEATKRN